MVKRKKSAGVQRRPDSTNKLVIFYAMWGETEDKQVGAELVAMGRSEDEFTENLAWWMLGVMEDQVTFERAAQLPPSSRYSFIKQTLEQHSEGQLSRDAYTLGVNG